MKKQETRLVQGFGPFRAVSSAVSSAVPLWRAALSPQDWQGLAATLRQRGGRLLGLWAEAMTERQLRIHALYLSGAACLWCSLDWDGDGAGYPTLSQIFPTASRQERAIADLLGVRAEGNKDLRPWLRHAAWPESFFPLRIGQLPVEELGVQGDSSYAFQQLPSDDLHEIPVGPVHAGTIEPGHFRFTCLGEQVLQLEERLGYTHKGTEWLFRGKDPLAGTPLAGRVSGDSTVAYAWAYVMAVENIAEFQPPARALALRGLFAERERLANHLGDLGALGNDAGFAFALTQLLAIKEELLRENDEVFGHRYLMDLIQPGGIARDLSPAAGLRLRQSAGRWQARLQDLELLLHEHAGLRDRLVGTGSISPERAYHWGMGGMAGRASGQAWDLRVQFTPAPYGKFPVDIALATTGDVAARWAVRFQEIYASLRWQDTLLNALPEGSCQAPLRVPEDGEGLGIVEGWRGEVFVALRLESGRIARCHPHDPSWSLWPVLEEAVLQDIVADFPLINKSFNLSYSGHDL
ncbi:NADH-quinone oxidoreductase subunit C [Acidithiobacillus sp. AMEEHan]|uniref:hydrogenase large subunit n=1 Tax=Acidithiobacillus sp. AMEEHan TaxID=2994951 RepID=UPI0027E50539|nr:NADH-quinone oxidoreductase subunit C [Acidithiobacillus sp. AMEEHan]